MRGSMHRRFIVRALAACGVSVGLIVASAVPASAQLGRLKRIAEDAAKKAATGEKPEPGKESREITGERIDAVLAVLTPMIERAQREAASRDVAAAYERDQKEATQCLQAFAKAPTTPSASKAQEMSKSADRQAALFERSQKAMSAGQYRLALASQDSATVLQLQMTASMLNATKCKPMPFRPTALIEADAKNLEAASQGTASSSRDQRSFEVPPANRAGMSTQLFGLTRERIALYGLLATKAITNSEAGKQGVFSDAETAVLDARKTQLVKMAPLFKASALEYKGWGDIKNW